MPAASAPAVDPAEFRRVMGMFATGVTVVTVEVGGEAHGMTANAVMSVSLDPPLVCVSVNRRARMDGLLQRAGGFAVNILAQDQQVLSQFFAGTWKHATPEYRLVPWTGGPRLVGCLAAADCRIEGVLEGGDHRIFLGRVLDLYRADGAPSPLLFFAGRYHQLRDPALAPLAPVDVWNPEEVQIFYDD
jgi:flavin reductase (DIM6/NTAB) family NADH-FMN oxidoreductase RutF